MTATPTSFKPPMLKSVTRHGSSQIPSAFGFWKLRNPKRVSDLRERLESRFFRAALLRCLNTVRSVPGLRILFRVIPYRGTSTLWG